MRKRRMAMKSNHATKKENDGKQRDAHKFACAKLGSLGDCAIYLSPLASLQLFSFAHDNAIRFRLLASKPTGPPVR